MNPRPILAPLRLIGTESALVESLEHFAARIAYAHNTSPAQVITLARNVARRLPYRTRARTYTFRTTCGYGPFSSGIVAALERLTGASHLRAGTLGALRKVLTDSLTGCFHESRRWCPECYRQHDDVRYDLLAWQLRTVSHCPRDGFRLKDRCPQCGSAQLDFMAFDKRSSCGSCGASLASGITAGLPPTSWEKWANAASGELIQFTSSPGSVVQGHPWRDFLKILLETGRLPADRSLAVFKAFTWKAQRVKPRLQTVFDYAALNCVTPLQVLLDPSWAASPMLPLAATLSPSPERTPRQSQLQKLRYAAALLVSMASEWQIPTPGWLARAFDCRRPSWSVADPPGYSAYMRALGSESRVTAMDKRIFDAAVNLIEADLALGGRTQVSAIMVSLAQRNPKATQDRVTKNLWKALVTVAVVRILRPGKCVSLGPGRVRAGKPRLEHC